MGGEEPLHLMGLMLTYWGRSHLFGVGRWAPPGCGGAAPRNLQHGGASGSELYCARSAWLWESGGAWSVCHVSGSAHFRGGYA